jgi:putative chitinase
MEVSKEELVASGICTQAMADKWCEQLNATMNRFEINTPYRVAGFLAQVSHESGGFQFVVENLNYTAEALSRVWPSRFPPDIAAAYARNPEKIANRAYCDRMGNGDEASGDGWTYRGRGLIQLTGKDNYAAFSLQCNNEALVDPNLVAEPALAAESAGWFWSRNGLNALADANDIVAMTKRINGGTHGIDHRQQLYAGAMSVFA